jgi:LCP family protein required for cell wall assembly
MLSIPRDLWVEIPGVGFNRINTAHFFAENEQPGSGPRAVMAVVEQNFKIGVDDYIRLDFNGIVSFVDALGGVPVTLETPVGKLSAGEHVLSGEQALAFVRDRSGTDDFFRMDHGQIFIRAVLRRLMQPGAWPRIPVAILAISENFESSMNIIERLRFGFTFLRVGPDGIVARQITREMTNGFITNQGAQVLDPNWELINPLVHELFGSR